MRFWIPGREAGNPFFVAVASSRFCGWDEQDVERYGAIAEERGTPLLGGLLKKSADQKRPAQRFLGIL